MEQKVIDMVSEFNLEDYVVYSSFNHDSIGLVRQLKDMQMWHIWQVIITVVWMVSVNMEA